MPKKKKKAKKRKGDPKGASALQKYSYRAATIGPEGSRKAHKRRRAENTAYGTQMRQYAGSEANYRVAVRKGVPSGTEEMFIPILDLPWETYLANEAKASKKAKTARKKAKHTSRMKKIRGAVTKGLKKAGVTRGSSTSWAKALARDRNR